MVKVASQVMAAASALLDDPTWDEIVKSSPGFPSCVSLGVGVRTGLGSTGGGDRGGVVSEWGGLGGCGLVVNQTDYLSIGLNMAWLCCMSGLQGMAASILVDLEKLVAKDTTLMATYQFIQSVVVAVSAGEFSPSPCFSSQQSDKDPVAALSLAKNAL